MEPKFLLIALGVSYFGKTVFCGQIAVPVDPYRSNEIPHGLHDSKHGIKMGVSNAMCDDGRKNLHVDFSGSSSEYTCTKWAKWKMKTTKSYASNAVLRCQKIDPSYRPPHFCMDKRIIYDTPLPTYRSHCWRGAAASR